MGQVPQCSINSGLSARQGPNQPQFCQTSLAQHPPLPICQKSHEQHNISQMKITSEFCQSINLFDFWSGLKISSLGKPGSLFTLCIPLLFTITFRQSSRQFIKLQTTKPYNDIVPPIPKSPTHPYKWITRSVTKGGNTFK